MVKRCLSLFAMFAVLVVGVSQAHATQVNTTLKVLIDNGWNVVAGDKRFDRFSLTSNVAAEDFQVIALHDGGLDPGPGLRFNVLNNAMTALDESALSAIINFRVTVLDPSLRIKDVSLNLTGYDVESASDDTGVTIHERVGTSSGGNDLAALAVGAFDPGADTLTDAGTFAGRSEIWVQKQLYVFADGNGDYASLISFEQRFSQESAIPEPVTAGLGVMGLAALALAATRRRRA